MNNNLRKLSHQYYQYTKSILVIIVILCITVTVKTESYSQTRKVLSAEEIDAINTLAELNIVTPIFEGWEIDPDVWRTYTYSQRKNITEKLSIYYKNYTERGKKMSGFCYFYNMATKKKIARWYENEFKEY